MSATSPHEAMRDAASDTHLGHAVQYTTDRLAQGREKAWGDFDAEVERERLRLVKAAAIRELPALIERFRQNAEARGTKVFLASTAEDAVHYVRRVFAQHQARQAVKSKSMATEEIHLREHLEQDGADVVESDLGEYICQLAGEPPSHLIVPAIHKTRQEIKALFEQVAGYALAEDTPTLAGFARRHLREKFLTADVGITGANAGIADTGTLMIVSNEGNVRMGTTLPPVHIAVMGIEKLVPDWASAAQVLRLLPRSATGQSITTYVSWLTGPRGPGEADGPSEVHVVLLDNGRHKLLGTEAEELLGCIRCGACLNVCPVYRTVGGHAYGSVIPGPIGAALGPRLWPEQPGIQDLPWASTLCGACREACPVGIHLDDQLLWLRRDLPKDRDTKEAIQTWQTVARQPHIWRASVSLSRWVLQRWPGWVRTRSPRLVRRWFSVREWPTSGPQQTGERTGGG